MGGGIPPKLMEDRVSKLFAAFAFALLSLPGFAWAEESCHHGETAMAEAAAVAANGLHADHAHPAAHAGGIEEVPQTVPVSSPGGHDMKGDCPHRPDFAHACSAQLALMKKCGMHGCCIKTETPLADAGSSPKVAPEMAIDARQGLNPLSIKGIVTPYLPEKLSSHYPPVPRPPAA